MKTLIINAPGDARLVERPKPEPGPRDVVSRVVYSGICGTDLGIYNGTVSFVKDGGVKFPVSVGHEWVGIVDSVGPEVTGFKPGDRVVSDNGVSCGACANCLTGDISNCLNGRSLGTINTWDYGSFAEYILIPEWNMYHLDDKISLKQGALIEPATIGMAGVCTAGVGEGDYVLITGTGAVGLSAAASAKAFGAKRVFIAGRKPFKLETGLKIGADAAINLTAEDMPAVIMKETNGKGVSRIVETSGSARVFDQALDCAGAGCSVALVGFYEDKFNEDFNLDRVVLKNIVIKGTTGMILTQRVMELMSNGLIDLTPLVTNIYPADKAVEVFATASQKSAENIKMLIQMT